MLNCHCQFLEERRQALAEKKASRQGHTPRGSSARPLTSSNQAPTRAPSCRCSATRPRHRHDLLAASSTAAPRRAKPRRCPAVANPQAPRRTDASYHGDPGVLPRRKRHPQFGATAKLVANQADSKEIAVGQMAASYDYATSSTVGVGRWALGVGRTLVVIRPRSSELNACGSSICENCSVSQATLSRSSSSPMRHVNGRILHTLLCTQATRWASLHSVRWRS